MSYGYMSGNQYEAETKGQGNMEDYHYKDVKVVRIICEERHRKEKKDNNDYRK